MSYKHPPQEKYTGHEPPCPSCGHPIQAVTTRGPGRHIIQPCGHRVLPQSTLDALSGGDDGLRADGGINAIQCARCGKTIPEPPEDRDECITCTNEREELRADGSGIREYAVEVGITKTGVAVVEAQNEDGARKVAKAKAKNGGSFLHRSEVFTNNVRRVEADGGGESVNTPQSDEDKTVFALCVTCGRLKNVELFEDGDCTCQDCHREGDAKVRYTEREDGYWEVADDA